MLAPIPSDIHQCSDGWWPLGSRSSLTFTSRPKNGCRANRSKDYTITPWQMNTASSGYNEYILSIWFYLYLLSIAYDIMIPNDSRTNLRSVRCLGSGHVAIPTALGRLSSALRRLPQPTSSTPSCSGFLSRHKTHQNSMGKVESAENAWKMIEHVRVLWATKNI